MLPPLASLTEPLVTLATDVVGSLGLLGIFVLMVLESACIPIPSETTMLFAGFNVAQGEYSLLAVTAVGTSANLLGSSLAYAVGYFGRLELLERHGHLIRLSPTHLHHADRWFARYGALAVVVTRMVPIVRTFISLPAGVARMPFGRFAVLTFIGCLPWVFLLALAGQQAQEHWTTWKESLRYVDYAVLVALFATLAIAIVRWRRPSEPTP